MCGPLHFSSCQRQTQTALRVLGRLGIGRVDRKKQQGGAGNRRERDLPGMVLPLGVRLLITVGAPLPIGGQPLLAAGPLGRMVKRGAPAGTETGPVLLLLATGPEPGERARPRMATAGPTETGQLAAGQLAAGQREAGQLETGLALLESKTLEPLRVGGAWPVVVRGCSAKSPKYKQSWLSSVRTRDAAQVHSNARVPPGGPDVPRPLAPSNSRSRLRRSKREQRRSCGPAPSAPVAAKQLPLRADAERNAPTTPRASLQKALVVGTRTIPKRPICPPT
jgi:hypothetical protein